MIKVITALIIIIGAYVFINQPKELPTTFPVVTQEAPQEISLPDRIVLTTEAIPILYPHDHEEPGGVVEHGEIVQSDIWVAPKDIKIIGTMLELHNADKSLLHHMDLIDTSMKLEACSPRSVWNQILLSQGADFWPEYEASDYILYVKKGTPLQIRSMFHNPFPPYGEGKIHRNVSLSYHLNIEEATEPDDGSVELIDYFLTDNPCSLATFEVPANSSLVMGGIEFDGFNGAEHTT